MKKIEEMHYIRLCLGKQTLLGSYGRKLNRQGSNSKGSEMVRYTGKGINPERARGTENEHLASFFS